MPDFLTKGNAIVIGAGPAGLAVGACLRKASIPSILLEKNDRVASAWHHHYDRLHLHTDIKNSGLLFLAYPNDYPRYLSRDQLIAYLESYAEMFQLDIRFHQEMISASYQNGRWEVETQDNLYHTKNLVIAAGSNHEPFRPAWPGQGLFKGTILHSSEYKNGGPFKGKNVLVVGFGNSGGEIAIDLWEHGAQASLCVRSSVNVIPRELFGLPILSIGILLNRLPTPLADAINAPILRATIGDITKYGLRKLPYGPLTQIRRDAQIPLIDIGTLKLIKDGQIRVYEGIKEFTEAGIIFNDGEKAQFDAVILATGYRPRVDAFLTDSSRRVYDHHGRPFSSGHETSLPGLYFCGYYVAPTGMLREVGIEAQRISQSHVEKLSDDSAVSA